MSKHNTRAKVKLINPLTLPSSTPPPATIQQPARKPKTTAVVSQVQDKEDSATHCICGEAYGEEKCIKCNDCKKWWHYKCTGCSAPTIKALENLKSSKFSCAICTASNIQSPLIKQQILAIIQSSATQLPPQTPPPAQTTTRQSFSSPQASPIERGSAQQPQHSHALSPDTPEHLDPPTPEPSSAQRNSPKESSPKATATANSKQQDLLVILDGLIPGKFRNSRAIQREVNRYKPDIKYNQIHSLHLGGIAIYCKDETSKQIALEQWPIEAFEHAHVSAHPPATASGKTQLVARNLPPQTNDKQIEEQIKIASGSNLCTIRRFFNRTTNKYMPVAEITVDTQKSAELLLKETIKFNKSTICFEPKRRQKIVRCYNCQSYGHPAYQCTKNATCCRCGERNISLGHTCGATKCANCDQEHHADSKHCNTYKAILKLNTRHLLNRQHENPCSEC